MATRRVIGAMLESPANDHYGLQLMQLTGLQSGSLYPILSRLEQNGWITGRWEEVDASVAGRPRRRLYRLTPNGVIRARSLRDDQVQVAGLRPEGRPA